MELYLSATPQDCYPKILTLSGLPQRGDRESAREIAKVLSLLYREGHRSAVLYDCASVEEFRLLTGLLQRWGISYRPVYNPFTRLGDLLSSLRGSPRGGLPDLTVVFEVSQEGLLEEVIELLWPGKTGEQLGFYTIPLQVREWADLVQAYTRKTHSLLLQYGSAFAWQNPTRGGESGFQFYFPDQLFAEEYIQAIRSQPDLSLHYSEANPTSIEIVEISALLERRESCFLRLRGVTSEPFGSLESFFLADLIFTLAGKQSKVVALYAWETEFLLEEMKRFLKENDIDYRVRSGEGVIVSEYDRPEQLSWVFEKFWPGATFESTAFSLLGVPPEVTSPLDFARGLGHSNASLRRLWEVGGVYFTTQAEIGERASLEVHFQPELEARIREAIQWVLHRWGIPFSS